MNRKIIVTIEMSPLIEICFDIYLQLHFKYCHYFALLPVDALVVQE